MNKNGLIATLGTGLILGLVILISNFNIRIDVNSNDGREPIGRQMTPQAQDDSMAGHHGGGTPADATLFNDLVGKTAPDFTLESYDGKKITLSELKGQNVILFFNEGLMCYPACWNQISAFGKDTALQSKAVVLNITVDPKHNSKQAVNKMPELAAATVLFDSSREASKKYGVLTLPSSMHKGQFPGHSYVIIDKEGTVKFIRDDVSMAVRNDELSAELDKL